jgi:prepilin-type N-terminal cleavage/methylation domain-containing protein
MRGNRKGFTLIELLIVVVIIGILAAIFGTSRLMRRALLPIAAAGISQATARRRASALRKTSLSLQPPQRIRTAGRRSRRTL